MSDVDTINDLKARLRELVGILDRAKSAIDQLESDYVVSDPRPLRPYYRGYHEGVKTALVRIREALEV